MYINNQSFFAQYYQQMRQQLVKVGMCSLNNDPLHFAKNYKHICQSIRKCKELGCSIRFGAELQVSGYTCSDHFNEYDTILHSWDVIGDIIESGVTNDIVCCIGSPVEHATSIYNCLIVIYNGKIIGIRPKMALADGDNYFETRWFSNWKNKKKTNQFKLPKRIQQITGQKTVPLGQFIVDFNDTALAFQICQEAWDTQYPMIDAALDGAQIFVNPSGSHVERNKMTRRFQLLQENTQKSGGCYCYVNVKGTIGQRTYFDGGSFFVENGKIKTLTELQILDDVIVTPAVCNLSNVRTFRLSNSSYKKYSQGLHKIPRVKIQIDVATYEGQQMLISPQNMQRLLKVYNMPHVTFEPSLFLWDYLRKSKASGFFLALSGGLDSCSVALTVYNMCFIVFKEIKNEKQAVLADLRRIVGDKEFMPKNPGQIMFKLLFSCYMATSNSSYETLKRAANIAQALNCHHRQIDFQNIYQSFKEVGQESLGINLNFKKEGGNWGMDLALQNIQARSRMLLSYLFAQTQLQIPKRPGFLLVLGSSNLDESLRGYFTKYDCSAADLNPIGSFSKLRLKEYLEWNKQIHGFQFIDQVMNATPTAELQPLKEGQIAQTDEEDMGLTYRELGLFGRLRNIDKLGPVSMFDRIHKENKDYTPENLAQKIKKFFKFYSINRHKMNILPPSFHYDLESCDDNRFDMRPIFYDTDWSYQFQILDKRVQKAKSHK